MSHTPASWKGWGGAWADKPGATHWDGSSDNTGGLATAPSQDAAVGHVPSVAGADTRKDANEGILQLLQKHHEEVKVRLTVLETKVEQILENSENGSTHGKGSWPGKGSDADSIGKGSCAGSDKSRSTTPRPQEIPDCSWHGPTAPDKIYAAGTTINPGDVLGVESWSQHFWQIFNNHGEEAFATAMTACVTKAITERKARVFYTKSTASRFLAMECAACEGGTSFNYSPSEMKPKITKHQVDNGCTPKYIQQKRELCNFSNLSSKEYGYDQDDPEHHCSTMKAWLNAQLASTSEAAS